MKKSGYVLAPLCLCLLLCSCAPMRSNSELAASSRAMESAPSAGISSPVEQSSQSGASMPEASASAGELGTVELDPRDVGTLRYHVLEMRYGESMEELGIPLESLSTDNLEGRDSGALLLILRLENVDYPMDDLMLDEEGRTLVNSLHLYPSETIDQGTEVQPWADSHDPLYFDRSPQEEKKYFALPAPEPGQYSEEFQMAWGLSAEYTEQLKNDGLELVYTMSGLEQGVNQVCRMKLHWADVLRGGA